jgi:hypothetical protein
MRWDVDFSDYFNFWTNPKFLFIFPKILFLKNTQKTQKFKLKKIKGQLDCDDSMVASSPTLPTPPTPSPPGHVSFYIPQFLQFFLFLIFKFNF